MSSTNLIYVVDEKFIKNIDTEIKLRYIPLINKFGIDTKVVSSNTAFMYVIGHGFYAKFKTLNIIDKKNKLYSKLVNHYKLCDISNMYFIRYCDIIYFENTIKMKDYKEYCIKNDKKYITLPKDIDLMNIITYDTSTLNLMAIISNDSSSSTNVSNALNKSDGDGDGDEGSGDEGSNGDGSDDEGSGDEGSGDEGSGDEGSDDEGSDEGSDDEGSGDEGSDDEGSSDEGSSDEGSSDEGSSDSDEDGDGDYNIVPILWNPCTNHLKTSEYVKHIYTCKKCEFINNNNNLIYRKKKVKIISGKYKKIVDAYISSTTYNRPKHKNNSIILVAKINNPKSFYNDYSFLI
jgi:hypothetical protein